MKRRAGVMGTVFKSIKFIILAGIILAILPLFDWDLFKFAHWLFEKIWELINRVAEFFSEMEFFRAIFK